MVCVFCLFLISSFIVLSAFSFVLFYILLCIAMILFLPFVGFLFIFPLGLLATRQLRLLPLQYG